MKRWFASLLMLYLPVHALACETTSIPLNLVFSRSQQGPTPVTVETSLSGDVFRARFHVQAETVYGHPQLAPGEHPYQFDVVEIYLSVAGARTNLPYYEFELSAFNQTLELKIADPKHLPTTPSQFGIRHAVEPVPGGWIGTIEIPLRNLGWTGNPQTIVGNAFAVLGEGKARGYWSLFLPEQPKPSFHHPEKFRAIISCEDQGFVAASGG